MSKNSIDRFEKHREYIKGKKVLFIATKNVDYLRIVQEKNFFEQYALSVNYIQSEKKGYFIRIFEVFLKLLFTDIREYDLIFVGFQAQFIIPFFYWKMRKKEIWSDFFISLYDTLVFDRKKIKDKTFLSKMVKFLDGYTLHKSDLVICDTIAHGLYFCHEFMVEENKMKVFYLEADKSIYYPRSVDKPYKCKDKFIVFYFGSILPLQGVEIVLQAAELLEQENTIHFIVVGPIGEKIEKKELQNVTYIEWLHQEELANYIAFSDLCLAGHFSGNINKAMRTIPGKAYIYDAMNKKIILGDSTANHELFQEDEKHIFVKQGSAEKLAEVIQRYAIY